jgi:hypothetical protein
MRKHLFFLLALALLTGCQNDRQDIRKALDRQLTNYPQSTLQDVYKSFYQAHFGAEHMIKDTAAVRAYLLYELEVAAADTVPNPYYEPVGANGAYVRVYLRGVTEERLTPDQLMDAFLRSAKPSEQPQLSWSDEWRIILQTLQETGWETTPEETSLLSLAARDNHAVHHSDLYRNAYHPHYRIIRRDIFEQELQPLLN